MKTTEGKKGLFPTGPLAIIDKPADGEHHGGRRAMPPQVIYLHATGGSGSLSWLTTTSDPPVSCHRLIDKQGHIYKLVPDENVAYTQGYGLMGWRHPNTGMTCNTDGLSIELENWDTKDDPYPTEQVVATAIQCYEWIGKYGFLPILGHYDVDMRKKDPAYFPWGIFWDYLYRALRDGG